ncbi:MAG: MFS transporter [Sporolactobacillus sp.]
MKWQDWDINLKIRLIGEAFFNLLFWMFFPFMAIYFSERFGQQSAGFLLMIAELFAAVVGLTGGYFSDHYGRKRMMVFSASGQAICFAFFAFANSPWFSSPLLTFISFTLLGFFGQLYHPAGSAMIADVVPERYRSRIYAIFYTSTNIAVVLGPLLGGLLFFSHRFLALVICFVVCTALAYILGRWTHETVPLEQSAGGRGRGHFRDYLHQQISDSKRILSDRIFVLYIFAGILVAQAFMQLDLLIAIYTANHVPTQNLLTIGSWSWSLDGKQLFSLMVSANGLVVALFTVLVVRWMERFSERTAFMGSAFFYGAAMILIGSTANAWVLLASVLVLSWAELMTVGIQDSFIAKIAPPSLRGQYFSTSGLRLSLGRSLAPLALSLTVWIGYFHTFLVLALIAFSGMLLYGYIFSQYIKKERFPDARQYS